MMEKISSGIWISLILGVIIGFLVSNTFNNRFELSSDGRTKINKMSGKAWRLDYDYGKSKWVEISE